MAIILDITTRQASRRTGRAAPDHFEQVFERRPIGMGLLNLNGRWMLVNHALSEITGFTVDELMGKRFQDITHPDDADNDTAQRERLLAARFSLSGGKRYFDAAGELMSAILSVFAGA